MTQRQKTFLLVSILVGLLLVLLLLFLLFRNEEQTVPTPTPTGTSRSIVTNTVDIRDLPSVSPIPANDIPGTVPGTVDQQLLAKQTARLFVERFASNSNQNDNEHIDSVAAYMTPVMAAWAETQRTTDTASFEGVTTQVIASTVTAYTEANATVAIQTRQIVETEGNSELRARNGRVDLVRSGTGWLVDGFYWDN